MMYSNIGLSFRETLPLSRTKISANYNGWLINATHQESHGKKLQYALGSAKDGLQNQGQSHSPYRRDEPPLSQGWTPFEPREEPHLNQGWTPFDPGINPIRPRNEPGTYIDSGKYILTCTYAGRRCLVEIRHILLHNCRAHWIQLKHIYTCQTINVTGRQHSRTREWLLKFQIESN